MKVDINLNSEVKYRYVKFLLKYSNEVFVLRYITTLLTVICLDLFIPLSLENRCMFTSIIPICLERTVTYTSLSSATLARNSS